MTNWTAVKESYANACSFLRQVMGSVGYGALLVLCTLIGWSLGGVLIGGVGFLIALGISFILMDVSHTPSDGECEENQKENSS